MSNANRVIYCSVAVIMALILSLAWFFVGVEQVSGEFKEDTEYAFFIKKHMSTKFFLLIQQIAMQVVIHHYLVI